MDVGLIHTSFVRGGGMEAYLMSLIRGFLEQNDRVTVYARKVDGQLAGEMGCAVRRIRPLGTRKLREYRFLARLNDLPVRQDHDLTLSMAKTGCADVAVCGGVHAEHVRRVHRNALFRLVHDPIELWFEKRMFESVPRIMAHSRLVSEEIGRHYPASRNKIEVVYPPVDCRRFFQASVAEKARVRDLLGISSHRLTLLFVSKGHQRKGLDQLLAAFAGLDPRRYELLVAGSPIFGRRPDNVRSLGYINDLAPVYGAVDYTILPSRYEPFGLVVPESLQCGTPVIITRQVGAGELVTGREAVFLENNRPETIRETISGLERGREIEPGFARRHNLEIEQHIQAIKARLNRRQ